VIHYINLSYLIFAVDVVDIGSGEGYLGQVLHHEYGMSVVGVDERSEFTEGAQQRAQFIHKEREARDKKANPKESDPKLAHSEHSESKHIQTTSGVKHVVATITLDMVPEHFEHIAWPVSPPKQAILVG
jgi:protein-L-isoaspartate O-methyltransferase